MNTLTPHQLAIGCFSIVAAVAIVWAVVAYGRHLDRQLDGYSPPGLKWNWKMTAALIAITGIIAGAIKILADAQH